MNISNRDLPRIARQLNMSDKALMRLFGSVIVEWERTLTEEELARMASAGAEEYRPERFDIGLRFGKDNSMPVALPNAVDAAIEAVQGYRSTCPIVFGWLQGGDFDPGKIPERVNRAALIHASRTAGRLRAAALRKVTR